MPEEPRSPHRADTRPPWNRDAVWVLTPFDRPVPRSVVSALRADSLGLLDLGTDADEARRALDAVTRRTDRAFGVRATDRAPLAPAELPAAVDTVLLSQADLLAAWRADSRSDDRRYIVEVRSRDEAHAALELGADGLVAKGTEAGGRVGDVGTLLLTQQVLDLSDRPVWAQGGIGPHTATAALVAGAAGVVVDSQTALLDETELPRAVRNAVAAMDGSETRVVGGHRIYTRPDLWVAALDDEVDPDVITSRIGTRNLAVDAVPVGQDTALASGFATRYGSVGRMARSLRREVADRLDAAVRAEPLAPGNGVSGLAGTPYPVVQGPMTRVSDRPEFAAAVAEAGGLPYLALALLPGREVRPLLEATADLLGDRPWGVGVLGFVPRELREEQLAVIHDVKPPFALIAGGRPSQSVTLEEAGIPTFLHVPAPGLLERFLADGARRFVFEGSECGGHTGPRPSFALWEAQLTVLEAWVRDGGRPDQLDLLFAGGIHDARSAAMVAAMTGSLADAGARVGVLMGTAYLFTEEIVSAGAIGDEFQAQALACERTALLESGPGHVTRCARTPFVDLFDDTRRQLREAGTDPSTTWGELESLNLGRLRVASKGLKREGDDLVAVDRDEQRRDGMFMIGDVATLHSERGRVSDLHEAVSTGATRHVAEAAERFETRTGPEREGPRPRPADVAVVGMACVMPGAEDLDTFWRNIVDGANSITEVPAERWDVDTYFDPDWDHATATEREGSASKWGGFLPEVPFDALAYGIPPSSLSAIEPTQLLSLKVAADALADAGYRDRPFDRERTSVIFGAEGGTDQSTAHGFRAMFPAFGGSQLPEELAEWLPRISEDSFPGLLTNVIAGRIANRLDLGGKNLTVDAACASSLAAVDAACVELASGSSDVVLAGGADLHNGIQDYLLFTSVHALSTQGQCRTFDASADGITLGEGVACVVLKRLEDAERDGDRIYAVVRSVGASSDGRSLGLTAPRQEGQERALRRAYEQAGIDPADVGLVEAHGTGTVVGDRTELATLTETFTASGMGRGECVIGSVKSNIGHTKCAAGLAGLIKAAKALYHGVLPPTLHVERPNQGWDAETSPFLFLDAGRPWVDERRVAGVSAFGFGGTNFHAVLESHDDELPGRAVDAWPAELFAFRGDAGRVDAALAELAERLDARSSGQTVRLRDVAASVNERGGVGSVKVAIVADDLQDLRAKVDQARRGQTAPGIYLADAADAADGADGADGADAEGRAPGAGRIAFLFPGQGSQRPGMAGDLFTTFTEIRPLLEQGARWADVMLPPSAFDEAGRDAQHRALTDTRVAQPALGLADLAVADLLARFGVTPDLVGGHSYGELVALCVAGAFDRETLLGLSEARAEAILAAAGDDPGSMLAVPVAREQALELLDTHDAHDVVVANDNHPEQVVLAGPTEAVEALAGRLSEAGIQGRKLPVACAFHSPVVAPAAATLAGHLADLGVNPPEGEVFSNLTAGPYPADPDEVRRLLSGQVAAGVRFREQIEGMYDAGARVFVEVGPGRVLTGCVEKVLGDRPHVAVATDRSSGHGVRSLLHALARMAVAGVPVDVAELFEGRGVDPARWSKPAAAAGWTVNGHLVRDRTGEVVPGGLRPADTVPDVEVLFGPQAVGVGAGSNGAGPAAGQVPDQVLAEYFRTAHQIIESGHALLLNYLGVEPSPRTAPAALMTAPATPSPDALPAAAVGGNGASSSVSDTDDDAARVGGNGARPTVREAMGTPDGLLARLTAIVSERTGYPEDVLGPDLDVEADLSIDSIKRLEILSELADQIGLSPGGALAELEHLVEQLAARKTLQGIVDFLFEHAAALDGEGTAGASNGSGNGAGAGAGNGAGNGAAAAGGAEADAPADPSGPATVIPPDTRRFVIGLAEAPPAASSDARPTVRVTGSGPVAEALHRSLTARDIQLVAADADPADADLTLVTDLLDGYADMPTLYATVRSLLLDTAGDVLVVSLLGGGLGIDPPPPSPTGSDGPDSALPAGAGVRGLVKTAALEHPGREVRLVDLDPDAGVDQLAAILADEVQQTDSPVEVGWRDGVRRAPVVTERAGRDGTTMLPLTDESVVLFTGGARGITGRVALALARRSGGHLHLVGRSPWPEGDEDAELAACPDRMALRAALARRGDLAPKAIDGECDRILAAREIRRLHAEIVETGARVTYHQVDVRDGRAVAGLVDGIYRDHGRLDGIVHGAGILADHLIADKDPDEFERVFATKVDGALHLIAAVDRARATDGYAAPAFMVLFGSIAGACGNRGQADYAAANDALDALAAARQDLASRVVAIDWGPWSPEAGMVTDSLAKLFEQGGMGTIEVAEGIDILLDEVAVAGPGAPVPGRAHPAPAPQVVAARCTTDLIAAALGAVEQGGAR